MGGGSVASTLERTAVHRGYEGGNRKILGGEEGAHDNIKREGTKRDK